MPWAFAGQVLALNRRAGRAALVFLPVGRYLEMRGTQRLLAARVLGLRSHVLPRAGFALVAGFRRSLAPIFRARALRRGVHVLEMTEIRAGVDRGPLVRRHGCLSTFWGQTAELLSTGRPRT